MNQSQYEAGQIILNFSRIFANSMADSMKNAKLEDYALLIEVNRSTKFPSGGEITASIDLQKKSGKDRIDDSFCCFKYVGEGWRTLYEPRVLPDDVCETSAEDESGSGTEEAEKTAKPDSNSDYYGDDPSTLVPWWGLT